jgi:hypothetical protein
MIAIQKIGKSFMGALNYNIKKGNHPDAEKRAELLATNFTSLTSERIKAEVDLIHELRPNLNRYVYHTSLNFSNEEIKALTNDILIAIAEDYLEANGFTNNQYLVFRHHDADHPHIHLLVNRITFDGEVVSDSNNYKKSEAIVRQLEERYNLLSVEPSNKAAQKAPKVGEIEMAVRKGKPSDKMYLQEQLKTLLEKCISIADFITEAERQGIYFLFNQASTGRVSGVTYFINDFKIKGQALGNQFKWAELVKKINYEQISDSKTISEANKRTRTIYGDNTGTGEQAISRSAEQDSNGTTEPRISNQQQHGYRVTQLPAIHTGNPDNDGEQSASVDPAGKESGKAKDGFTVTDQDAYLPDHRTTDHSHNWFDGNSGIQISDDEDDAKYRRRRRGR